MKYIKQKLDLSKINSLEQLHLELKDLFGFPDFYGKNIHALIDCLSSLRYPEEGMTEVVLGKDEILLLETKGLSQKEQFFIIDLLIAIENVNQREITGGNPPSIYLSLN